MSTRINNMIRVKNIIFMKTELELKNNKFTQEGIIRYHRTINSYSQSLFETSIALGKRENSDTLEITQTHVRDAAISLQRKSKNKSLISIIGQSLEYICAILAGLGGGKLEHSWGIILFCVSIAVGVILFVVRTVNEER